MTDPGQGPRVAGGHSVLKRTNDAGNSLHESS